MKVRLAIPMFAAGVIWPAGYNDLPDGIALPSSAERLDEDFVPLPPEEEKPEPDTLAALAPKSALEQKK